MIYTDNYLISSIIRVLGRVDLIEFRNNNGMIF